MKERNGERKEGRREIREESKLGRESEAILFLGSHCSSG